MTTYNQLKYPPSSIGNSSIAAGAVSPDKLDSDAQRTGFKNRIINGDMRIDQRNAGASLTITNTGAVTYTLDRWLAYTAVSSKFSIQQNAGSVTPPTGFTKYLGATSLSTYSTAFSDAFLTSQYIEGYNTADLGWGTADAKTVTISFWVRSSLTGTFSLSVCNFASTRNYIATYTVNSANTWEYKTITVAGDTSGTWKTDTDIGIQLRFDLGSGSNFYGTAGAWSGSNQLRTSGSQSLVGTSGATFYITGVQLEKSSTATAFDYRAYGAELALCYRYYWKATNGGTQYNSYATGFTLSTTQVALNIQMPVTMRTAPSFSSSDPSTTMLLQNGSANYTPSTFGVAYQGAQSAYLKLNTQAMTGSNVPAILIDYSNSSYLAFSAEL